MPPPPIPTTFARKKAKILQDLSVPDGEYSDRSPKGSVDEGIRELIDEINAHKGFVTTSSCAGRISVFQEGNGRAIDSENEGREVETSLVVGGKGGGKFLFVSHEPVSISEAGGLQQLPELFGSDEVLIAGGDIASVSRLSGRRYVRFAFEPMILHVMTASLHHAKPLLSAAINSGFRESGVQSLKNLDDANACPMVAIRTAGLGLESIIACVTEGDEDEVPRSQPLVSKDYCAMLLKISNERFEANQQRIDKFRASLRDAMALESKKLQHIAEWESPEARRQRKRKQGLEAKEAAKVEALVSREDDQECLEFHPTD